LASFHLLAKLHVELRYAARERRHDLQEARWIGFNDRRQER
jgi:hypothetical protein